MLLSIVIPAYDRPDSLLYALETFARQISGRYERDIEILVTDDASPGHSLAAVEEFAAKHSFITFRRRSNNIGLERSLIAAAEGATGEYLWIFGDDDFLEHGDALDDVIAKLRQNCYDMLVLNRTRRNTDLSKLLSPNWMRLEPVDKDYAGLRAFCRDFGFISVIGFISVNIFRRQAFLQVNPAPYFGSMYPQLGMMFEAFHDKSVCLIGKPTVCHRTQTQEEKRAALGNKRSEADFMGDTNKRNALYFSHPFVRMLSRLKDVGALNPEDIRNFPENTVINGLLIQFLLDSVQKSAAYPDHFDDADWRRAISFFASLALDGKLQNQLAEIARQRFGKVQGDELLNQVVKVSNGLAGKVHPAGVRTVSVISPSFNQAEFLDECLSSIADQTLKPIEHFVYDPGSTDGSRDIARKFAHVTLFTEPDNGQSDAINKGFRAARGDVIAWLNSDDVFADPGVFQRVIDRFNQPDRPDIVYGKGIYIDERGGHLRDVYLNKKPETLPWRLQQEDGILQPALFMRRSVIEKVGEINGGLHFCMDYEYWIRCVKAGIKFAYIDENLALARYHTNNKTYGQRGKSYAEVCDMLVSHFGYANHNWLRRYAEFLSEGFDGVLANAANTTVKNEAGIEWHYVELMKAYNTGALTFEMLKSKPSEKGYGDTLRELGRLGLKASTPCKQTALDTAQVAGHVCYTVGPKRWAFDAAWKRRQIEKSHAFLRDKVATRTSDVCVIVGNGPSLKNSNLDLLKGHDVIISNNAFLEPKLLECAKYYTVVNYLVAEQSSQNINRLRGVPKVLPYWMSYCLNEDDDTYFVDAVGHAAFSKDMFKNMSWRHTVTFYNLHLAFGLGYKRVIMVGFDHFYKQSSDVKEGDIILTTNEDPNHFDSRYFRGKAWQAADVDMMEQMYLLAQTAYAEEGREIINATAGGALEVFPRMDLETALKGEAVNARKSGRSTSFDRAAGASVDETEVVAAMLSNRVGRNHVMVDVGAHFGTSAAFFDKLGWTIHCFEPDPSNRAKLVARFGGSRTVSIDQRAVNDKPALGVAFVTSSDSTGISGLNSFRDTHKQAARVDVTTVAEIVRDRNLSKIDFLKIDVEGYDFSVLKGIPWDQIKPDVIEAGFEDAKTVPLGHTYREVCEYLQDKGYAVYLSEWHPIIRCGIPHDWWRVIRYPDRLNTDEAWGNLLAFRTDPGLAEVERAFASLAKVRKPELAASAPAVAAVDNSKSPSTSTTSSRSSDLQSKAPPAVKHQAVSTAATHVPAATASAWHPYVHRDSGLPLYTRIALWAKNTSPTLFSLGRFAMRLLRFARRHWLLSLLALAALAALASLAAVYLLPQLTGYRPALDLDANLMTLMTALPLFAIAIAFAFFNTRRTGGKLATLLQSEIGTLRRQLLIAEQANAKLTRDLAAQQTEFTAHEKSAGAKLAALIEQISGPNSRLSMLAARSETVEGRVATIDPQISRLASEIASVKNDVGRQLSSVEQTAKALEGKVSAFDPQIGRLAGEMAAFIAFRTDADKQLKSLEQLSKTAIERSSDVAVQVQQAQEAARAVARTIPANNALGFQTFNRMLRKADAETLATVWGRALSVPLDSKTLHYMAHKACTLESMMTGRLATSIETILLRTVVAMGVNRREVNILEIGTLFGVGAAIMYDVLKQRFEHVHLTLLDPLDGYYSQGKPDIQTGQLVNEKTLLRNLSRVAIADDELTLIKRFSTDDEAITEAGRRPIDVLIIDGDHSLSGVKADFENYGKMVRLGGFIIFDDYDSPDWPDIKGYVDREISSCGWLAHVGNEFRTAVFRVTRRAENDETNPTS